MVGLNKMDSDKGHCTQCRENKASATCERCNTSVCPSCVCLITKPTKPDVIIRHSNCVTKRSEK